MRGARLIFRRWQSTEGTIHKSIIKDTVGKDGEKISERINLIQRFSQLSTTQKRLLAAYGLLSTGSFVVGVYNDGRQELIRHRTRPSSFPLHHDDWEAAKSGCKSNVALRFWEGVFFPYTCISNVLPYLVLATTKNDTKK